MTRCLPPSLAAACMFLSAGSALADIRVEFRESAPTDSFQITNTGTCATGPMTLTLDLETSRGRLIFDTTGSGAGVEVFQPFRLVSGPQTPNILAVPSDGDRQLTLSFDTLDPGAHIRFTIDVDDTLPQSELGQIRVSGSELEGGEIQIRAGAFQDRVGRFDTNGIGLVQLENCTS